MRLSETPPSDASSLARTWVAVLGQLEVELNRPVFETWVRGTRLIGFDEPTGTATVEAASSFACTNLQERFPLVILRALQARMPAVHDVEFVEPTASEFVPAPVAKPQSTATGAPGRIVGAMNCGFTLDRYVTSVGNKLARASCLSLLSSKSHQVSPVVVYGPPGLGKSHLIHALGNEAVRNGKSVACLSSEQFANAYISAMKCDNIEEFHRKVRSVDLFILDDLQYLTGKKATANELVHTIDAISTAGGSVVIASECSPKELALPERLISRLSAGLVTRIDYLDRDARQRFIAQATELAGTTLPAWAVERIASINGLSVRVLQGAVNTAIHLARNGCLDVASLDLQLSETIMSAALPAERTARDIIDEVAQHFATTFEEVIGRSRHRQAASARAVIAFVLKQRGVSQGAIAEMLGKRERTTVRDMLVRGEKLVEEDSTLRSRFGPAA